MVPRWAMHFVGVCHLMTSRDGQFSAGQSPCPIDGEGREGERKGNRQAESKEDSGG